MPFPTSIQSKASQNLWRKALSWIMGAIVLCASLSEQAAIAAPTPPTSGIRQAETASEQVYEGLETTQALVGKRESRNKAIAHGRDRASQKLDNLAQKAKRAPETLNNSEQHALEQLEIQR